MDTTAALNGGVGGEGGGGWRWRWGAGVEWMGCGDDEDDGWNDGGGGVDGDGSVDDDAEVEWWMEKGAGWRRLMRWRRWRRRGGGRGGERELRGGIGGE